MLLLSTQPEPNHFFVLHASAQESAEIFYCCWYFSTRSRRRMVRDWLEGL